MADSDYLVFPTFHDTFGFVPIEAMACGTPVITRDTCAQPEIVENDVSGVLLPFPNSEVGDWTMLHKSREPNYTDQGCYSVLGSSTKLSRQPCRLLAAALGKPDALRSDVSCGHRACKVKVQPRVCPLPARRAI